eukprot:scaffold102866_cov71-Phaeocystis_antarctica.AAC.4
MQRLRIELHETTHEKTLRLCHSHMHAHSTLSRVTTTTVSIRLMHMAPCGRSEGRSYGVSTRTRSTVRQLMAYGGGDRVPHQCPGRVRCGGGG